MSDETSRGVSIMLLPSAEYKAARPTVKEHHLTVCSFGKIPDYENPDFVNRWGRKFVDGLSVDFGPIPAVANGIGLFDAGESGWAVVDLIDGIGTFNVRWAVEARLSGLFADRFPKISRWHGFTPHITRAYLEQNDDVPFVAASSIDNVEFTFDAIGFWFGPEKYEVSL